MCLRESAVLPRLFGKNYSGKNKSFACYIKDFPIFSLVMENINFSGKEKRKMKENEQTRFIFSPLGEKVRGGVQKRVNQEELD